MDYYQLPTNLRWLEEGNVPAKIGNFNTDLGTLGTLLYGIVARAYKGNIPWNIETSLISLKFNLRKEDHRIQDLIKEISGDLYEQSKKREAKGKKTKGLSAHKHNKS